MSYGRHYDRTFEPPPGTIFTPVEARELAALIESDEWQQTAGDGRDIVHIGNGETRVLVETLRRFADMKDAQVQKQPACCIDDIAHALREPNDGNALFLRCDQHVRREKLADDFFAPPPAPDERAVSFAARNIVNQVLDAAAASLAFRNMVDSDSFVHVRQAINDRCDEMAFRVITALLAGADSSPAAVLADVATCEHENFSARVGVNRLTDEEGALTGFMADIVVTCVACRTGFVFLGVPTGMSLDQPTVGIDGAELRIPIAPSFVWVGPGKQLAARGFKVVSAPGSKSDA